MADSFIPPERVSIPFQGFYLVAGEGTLIKRRESTLPINQRAIGSIIPETVRLQHYNGRPRVRADYVVPGMDEVVATFWSADGQRVA